MNEQLRSRLEKSLGNETDAPGKSRSVRDGGKPGSKPKTNLYAASMRLFDRAVRLAKMESPGAKLDREALETACLALSLPFAANQPPGQTSMGVISITERCSQAAELLVGIVAGGDVPEALIDRTTSILAECPRRTTRSAEARVLADAVNIEDFGVSGLCRAAALLVPSGGDLTQLIDAFEKREQYGYWDSRLKDSFHFESTRSIARNRLKTARDCIRHLLDELREDTT